jgi:hypothetical protein
MTAPFFPYLNPISGMATSNGTSSFTVPGPIMVLGLTVTVMGGWPSLLGAAGWTAGGIAAGKPSNYLPPQNLHLSWDLKLTIDAS